MTRNVKKTTKSANTPTHTHTNRFCLIGVMTVSEIDSWTPGNSCQHHTAALSCYYYYYYKWILLVPCCP